MTFPGLYAELAKAYQSHFGISDGEFRRMLAAVSALGYRNGAENPRPSVLLRSPEPVEHSGPPPSRARSTASRH